jgi:glyoxylase-like metal-dependent hydrolase (beta-lactamase superfamily II)
MKRLALFGTLVVLLGLAYVRTVESQSGTVRQLAPGVYSRQGDRETQQPANTSWIEFRDFVVVIEANTPWGIKAALPEIRKTTSKPIRYAFDTHYHWDTHARQQRPLRRRGHRRVLSGLRERARDEGKDEWEQMSKRTGEYSLASYRLQAPSVMFGDFMAIDDGERRLELRRVGPAHTIGDAVAFLPKEGILFTGDLCVNWRSGNNVGDRDADHQHWVQVLNEMAGWNVKTVVPGHGGLGTVATLRAQSAFIDDLWKQVSAGKKAGKTVEQLAKEIDLSKHGDFAADAQQNQSAIRSVFRKAPG